MIYKLTMTAEARVNIRNTSITVNGRVACYREKAKSPKDNSDGWRNLLCHLKALQLIDSRAFIADGAGNTTTTQLSKRNSVQINAKANLVVKTFSQHALEKKASGEAGKKLTLLNSVCSALTLRLLSILTPLVLFPRVIFNANFHCKLL